MGNPAALHAPPPKRRKPRGHRLQANFPGDGGLKQGRVGSPDCPSSSADLARACPTVSLTTVAASRDAFGVELLPFIVGVYSLSHLGIVISTLVSLEAGRAHDRRSQGTGRNPPRWTKADATEV